MVICTDSTCSWTNPIPYITNLTYDANTLPQNTSWGSCSIPFGFCGSTEWKVCKMEGLYDKEEWDEDEATQYMIEQSLLEYDKRKDEAPV